jgi:hypothetical protein
MAEGRRIARTAVGRPHGVETNLLKKRRTGGQHTVAPARAFVSLTINFRALR